MRAYELGSLVDMLDLGLVGLVGVFCVIGVYKYVHVKIH